MTLHPDTTNILVNSKRFPSEDAINTECLRRLKCRSYHLFKHPEFDGCFHHNGGDQTGEEVTTVHIRW